MGKVMADVTADTVMKPAVCLTLGTQAGLELTNSLWSSN